MVGFFAPLGWTTFCYTVAQVIWVGKSGLVQLQLTFVRLMHKLCLFLLKLWSHAHGRRNCYKRVMADRYNGTIIKATHLLLDEMKLLQMSYDR